MPAVSEAQRRKMAVMKARGDVAAGVAEEFIRTPGPLPERVRRRGRKAARGRQVKKAKRQRAGG